MGFMMKVGWFVIFDFDLYDFLFMKLKEGYNVMRCWLMCVFVVWLVLVIMLVVVEVLVNLYFVCCFG